MRWNSLGGTRPSNTRASVPRLIPLYNARTTTSSGDGVSSGSVRISPWPGAAIQNACAASAAIRQFWGFARDDTIPQPLCGPSSGGPIRLKPDPTGYEAAAAKAGSAAKAGQSAMGPMRFGAANQITLVRALLVAGLASFAAQPATPTAAWRAVVIAILAALLDGLDGWVARRTGTVSAFGTRFDMETDAALILVLAILAWQYGKAGPWVLLSGLLRYIFVAAGWLWPWMAGPLASTLRAKIICVVQIVALIVATAPAIAPPASAVVAAVGLLALCYSFLVDTRRLWLRTQ